MYMTFAGEYRGASHGSHGHAAQGHDDHGHGHGEPHESPWVMLGPLVILAILSTVGGLVGIGNGFEHFLDPVFQQKVVEVAVAQGTAPEAVNHMEYVLMGLSISVAALGWLLAYFLYSRRPELPARIATSLGGLYHTVVNKYYVDEIYAALFIKPLIEGSSTILWKGVDQGMIDATVNNAASSARHISDGSRHMQSGNLRSYAGWVAAGGAAVIAYMVWMGVR
jgi:NADH-quinone oxidoreductase subunit L